MKSIILGEGITILNFVDTQKYQFMPIDTIYIHPDVEIVGYKAFWGFWKVKKIIFLSGSKCKEIKDYAFNSCFLLKSIILPLSLERVGNQVFSYCYSLSSLYFYQKMSIMGKDNFFWCASLQSVYFENSNISIPVFSTVCSGILTLIIGNKTLYSRQMHNRKVFYTRQRKWQDYFICRATDVTKIQNGTCFGEKYFYIWPEHSIKNFHGYGKTLKEAKGELDFIMGNNELRQKLGKLTPETEIGLYEYRILTKDCKDGAESFLKERNIDLNEKRTIQEVYDLTKDYHKSWMLKRIIDSYNKEHLINESEKTK